MGSKIYSKPLIHGMTTGVALFVNTVYAAPAAVSSTVFEKRVAK